MLGAPLQTIHLQPIGVIHSPHTEPTRTPIQPVYAQGIAGRAEIYDAFVPGLQDLEGFSHIHLIYLLHRAGEPELLTTPYLDTQPRGVFSTRSPHRPNPIGLSLARLVGIEGNFLLLEDVDILDGTPLLDIKPYVTRFDVRPDARCGWQDAIDESTARQRGSRE